MRFHPTVFQQLLQPLDRRAFGEIVARHDGDAYDKSCTSWQHLATLIYAQLARTPSLRALKQAFNADSHMHYHIGCGPIARSTLADANQRRPPAIFAEVFERLAGEADRRLRRDAMAMVRLVDATPIQLGRMIEWCTSNGRIRGLKMHVVFEPGRVLPRRIDITDATINDVEMGRAIEIEPGATYVFDKAYCDYRWWTQIHDAGSVFLTRKKTNARFATTKVRPLEATEGDGFTVLCDEEVRHKTRSHTRLAMPLRLVRVRREEGGGVIELISNDLTRSAVEIAELYKARWQIELLFRWLKQNLELSRFLGRSDNAIRLQIYAAMIAFLLLRLAASRHRAKQPPIRFAELIGAKLATRRAIARLDQPPPVNAHRRPPHDARQLALVLQ